MIFSADGAGGPSVGRRRRTATRVVSFALALASSAWPGLATAQEPGAESPLALVEQARRFWLGETPEIRAAAAASLAADRSPFEAWYRAIRATPRYPEDVPVGRVDRFRVDPDGVPHPYVILVPEDYDPARSYPALVWLHGGVNRGPWPGPEALWANQERVADPDRIVLLPGAWAGSAWWHDRQIDNLRSILRTVGRTYHLDTDRVHLLGISDGGSGVWYQALRAQTPWASFLSFIGHPAVLASPTVGVEGQMYVTNLRNRPLMAVNGGRDRLYPTRSVDPYVEMLRGYGVPILYRPQPDAGHDLSWMPEEEARVDSFLVATSRDPLPEELEWVTADPARGRFSWLIIDEIGPSSADPELPDRNEIRMRDGEEPYLVFPHPRPAGRVRAERDGNLIRISSQGVRRLRVLVSPDVFDLDVPLTIEVNGIVRHEGRPTPDRGTLLDWAGRDGDRSMLFAAEIEVVVP